MIDPEHPWEYPDCPDCGGHVFVDFAQTSEDFQCHNCGIEFAEPRQEIRRASELHPEVGR
jgi:DNA-directed RNA polymerase subunit M/transcription elongation factor TFIIS